MNKGSISSDAVKGSFFDAEEESSPLPLDGLAQVMFQFPELIQFTKVISMGPTVVLHFFSFTRQLRNCSPVMSTH